MPSGKGVTKQKHGGDGDAVIKVHSKRVGQVFGEEREINKLLIWVIL